MRGIVLVIANLYDRKKQYLNEIWDYIAAKGELSQKILREFIDFMVTYRNMPVEEAFKIINKYNLDTEYFKEGLAFKAQTQSYDSRKWVSSIDIKNDCIVISDDWNSREIYYE